MSAIPSSNRNCGIQQPKNQLKDNTVHLEDVEISFQRTVRVPDNTQCSELPPNLGNFPLYRVKDYGSKLPSDMVAKGGIFFPMYQNEAMWILFQSKKPYAVKIYVGAVNAVSGEPAAETAATKLRRQNLLSANKTIQDYVIIPQQIWLDGIATSQGKVRQFVAMPIGSGYSVEAQVTGEDVTGGLQFEITPATNEYCRRYQLDRTNSTDISSEDPVASKSPYDLVNSKAASTPMRIYVKTSTGKTIALSAWEWNIIRNLKAEIYEQEGFPIEQQRLIYSGRSLEDDKTLSYYSLKNAKSTVHLTLRLREKAKSPRYPGELPPGEITSTEATPQGRSLAPPPRRAIFAKRPRSSEQFSKAYGTPHASSLASAPPARLPELTSGRSLPTKSVTAQTSTNTAKQSSGPPKNDTPPPAKEMNIAPGGLISQCVVKDIGWNGQPGPQPSIWDASLTKVFNVQILNTLYFHQVTGFTAPPTPIDAHTCAALGIPFYSMQEQPTDVAGHFPGLKSIGQIDGVVEPAVKPSKLIHIGPDLSSLSASAISVPGSPTPSVQSSATLPASTPSPNSQSKGKDKGKGNSTSSSSTNSIPGTKRASRSAESRIGPDFYNPKGPMAPFRDLSALERALRAQEMVTF